MKHWIILATLVISLFGDSYPRLYSLLGDTLFDANSKLEQFKSIDSLTSKIETYQSKSSLILKQGLELESNESFTTAEKKKYLSSLRKLDSSYKNLIGALQQELLSSIKDNNYSKFTKLSNSSLTDIFDNKNILAQAIKYYTDNKKKGVLTSLDKLISDQKIKKKYADSRKTEPYITPKVRAPQVSQPTIKLQSYKDTDILPYKIDIGIGLEECQERCIKDQECKVVIFNLKLKRCNYKNQIGFIKNNVSSSILGIKS